MKTMYRLTVELLKYNWSCTDYSMSEAALRRGLVRLCRLVITAQNCRLGERKVCPAPTSAEEEQALIDQVFDQANVLMWGNSYHIEAMTESYDDTTVLPEVELPKPESELPI